MADLYTSEQGKRLFGFIAAAGSAGSLLGPTVAATLAVPIGRANLLIIAALLVEAAVFYAMRLEMAAEFHRFDAVECGASSPQRQD